MKNLSEAIFDNYFPDMINRQTTVMTSNDNMNYQHSLHDPNQRKGKMRAPHRKNKCEACLRGLCFA